MALFFRVDKFVVIRLIKIFRIICSLFDIYSVIVVIRINGELVYVSN